MAFFNATIKDLFVKIKEIPSSCFQNMTSAKMIIKGVQSIGDSAFQDLYCKCLELEFDSLKYIKYQAFYIADGIQSLEIPNTVVELGANCFYRLGLRKVKFELPSSLLEISHGCFSNTLIKKITIPNSVIKICQLAFAYSEIRKVDFENNSKLLEIGPYCFRQSALERIFLPSSLKILSIDAFKFCLNLITVVCDVQLNPYLQISPSPVQMICYLSHDEPEIEKIFPNLPVRYMSFQPIFTNLMKLTTPEDLTIITRHHIVNQLYLRELFFSEQVEEINGVIGCHNLELVKLPSSLNKIGQTGFLNCSIKRIVGGPAGVKIKGFQNTKVLAIEDSNLNPKFFGYIFHFVNEKKLIFQRRGFHLQLDFPHCKEEEEEDS